MTFEAFQPNTIIMHNSVSDGTDRVAAIVQAAIQIYKLVEPVRVEYSPFEMSSVVTVIDNDGEVRKLMFEIQKGSDNE